MENKQAGEWVSADEPPKLAEAVLVWVGNLYPVDHIAVGFFDGEKWWIKYTNDEEAGHFQSKYVVSWMPLPSLESPAPTTAASGVITPIRKIPRMANGVDDIYWEGYANGVDSTLAASQPSADEGAINNFWKKTMKTDDILPCYIRVGDTVESVTDVFSETDYDKEGAKNVGIERYVVNKVEYWPQGEGYIVYGDRSDKRDCQVWHHERDLKIVEFPIPNQPPAPLAERAKIYASQYAYCHEVALKAFLAGAADTDGRFAEWASAQLFQYRPDKNMWRGEGKFHTTSALYQQYLKQ